MGSTLWWRLSIGGDLAIARRNRLRRHSSVVSCDPLSDISGQTRSTRHRSVPL